MSEHLHYACLRPCCAGRDPRPPALKLASKECPMCGERFRPRELGKGKVPTATTVVGIIFDRAECRKRFEAEIGGEPLFYDFSKYRRGGPITVVPRVCRCGEVITGSTDACRLCRIKAKVERKLLGEATRIALARKRKAAALVYRPFSELPVVE